MCCLWLLLRFSSRVEQMWQTLWPTKLKIVTIWPLQKKFANPCCQPLHVDEHLAPLIMQLWKQAFTYSIVSCINKCIQSWDNFYVHFNIPYQICSHLIACFQDNLSTPGICQTFLEFKVLLPFLWVTEISKFTWWLKTWLLGGLISHDSKQVVSPAKCPERNI